MGKKENSCWPPKAWTCFHFLTLDSRHTLMTDATCLTTDGHNSCAAPDLQPKHTHTHTSLLLYSRPLTHGHTCASRYQWWDRSNVFLHIYWTNNTVKYMSACVCVCACVRGGYRAVAGWLEVESGGEAGAASGLDTSTCAKWTRKRTSVLGHQGCLFSLWGVQTDWLLYVLRGRLCFPRQLEADGGQASYSLQPAGKQSSPTPHRAWREMDRRTRRNKATDFYCRRNDSSLKLTDVQHWKVRLCACLLHFMLKPGNQNSTTWILTKSKHGIQMNQQLLFWPKQNDPTCW